LALLIIGARLYDLRSDPYPRLDWSAGLLTDEGFYIHNARNVVLFGHAVTDEFNNMLLSPVLHAMQVAVFMLFGVGSVQARLIGVFSSLLAIGLIWDGLRRLYGARVAWLAAVLLGLDHVNLLFSRMALMDPFAAFGAALAFRIFVAAHLAGARAGRRRMMLYGLSGFVLMATILNRSICAYLLPAPFLGAWAGRAGRPAHTALALGLTVALGIWLAAWWAPNRAEMTRVTRYYRLEQVQPRSLPHLWNCLYRGAFGDHRGISPYLFRHTPVMFGLALSFLAAMMVRSATAPDFDPAQRAGTAYLTIWLVFGWLAISASAYSPARYYVSTYPPLAAVAAIAYHRLPDVMRLLGDASTRARTARAALAAFLVFHAVQSIVHRGGVVDAVSTALLLYALPAAVGLIIAWWHPPAGTVAAVCAVLLPLLWMGVNGWWLTDWLRTMRHSQYAVSTELGRSLPPDSVLIGDVAPGVCLDNGFVAVNVIPGLCNGEQPVERFAGKPRFVVVLDGRWKERYWLDRYPELVSERRRLLMRRVLRWDIGVYPVLGPNRGASYGRTAVLPNVE
jgi:4-amino-4-deoxy-L-arabinose transferase-like glycosyltransferase